MIIGLGGLSGSGKDTAANWLVENKNFTRRSFADPLKNLLFNMNPNVRTRENVVRPLKEIISMEGSWERAKMVHPEVRKLLQVFATDFIRNKVDEDFWIKLATFKLDPSDNVVFSDVRFQNEVDYIKSLGGTVVQITSTKADLNKMNHSSEEINFRSDFIIANNGSLKDLYSNMSRIVDFYS